MEEKNIKTENNSNDFNNKIDLLFGKMFSYNMTLLKKSNDIKNGFTGEEVFDFFITSHGQSLIKSVYFGYVESRGIMLNSRSILEGLALKEMLKQGDISDKQLELLKYQVSLIEKRQYKRFVDIVPEIMFPKQMDEEYEFCRDKYFEILKNDFSEQKIKSIINSNIPFLCNPKINFTSLIKEYLGKGPVSYYKTLSILVHPNPNIDFGREFTAQIIGTIIGLLENEYGHLDGKGYTLSSHYLICGTSHESKKYINAANKIMSAFETIKDNFAKDFGNNYVSNTMSAISSIVQDMVMDKILGLQEQMKCKIKPLVEIIASFHRNYIMEDNVGSRYQLFVENTRLKLALAENEEYDVEKAYSIYKQIYQNGIELDIFKEVFQSSTGYSIDEKGNTVSINSMVRDVALLIKNNNDGLSFSDVLMLDYVESQMLSHANGYMWFANLGAFTDVSNLMFEINYLLIRVFECLQTIFYDYYNETGEYHYRKTSTIFRDAIKDINSALKIIGKVQKKPLVFL